MKTLYLLCGLAFSGKSTLAKAIVNYLNCASLEPIWYLLGDQVESTEIGGFKQ
ncbi:hypothetical protein [Nostoc sp.]